MQGSAGRARDLAKRSSEPLCGGQNERYQPKARSAARPASRNQSIGVFRRDGKHSASGKGFLGTIVKAARRSAHGPYGDVFQRGSASLCYGKRCGEEAAMNDDIRKEQDDTHLHVHEHLDGIRHAHKHQHGDHDHDHEHHEHEGQVHSHEDDALGHSHGDGKTN